MRLNKWTLGLAAVGLVSLPSVMQAEEKMSPVNTALASTVISGYVNTAAQWDLGTGNALAPGYAYNGGKQDMFSLNAVKLSVERPMDEAQWAAGYKVDLMFGPDANALRTQSGGLGIAGVGGLQLPTSDFAIRQAYVALRAPVGNGLDFKMGVFDSILGYETHDAGNNPNYTRSYGYTMEPTTHTGLLASYRFSEAVSASLGVANTFGPAINSVAHLNSSTLWSTIGGLPIQVGSMGGPKGESYKTYMGSLTLTAPASWGFLSGSTLYGGIVNGFKSSGVIEGWNQTSWYVGATVATPVKGLRVGAAFDYTHVHPGSAFPLPYGSSYQWAAALYASMELTEKLNVHLRGEYAAQDPVLSFLNGIPSKVFAATATVQYDLWKNVISRLEVRWDHSANGNAAFGGSWDSIDLGTVGSIPVGYVDIPNGDGSDRYTVYNDMLSGTDVSIPVIAASKKNNFMVALNVIYKF